MRPSLFLLAILGCLTEPSAVRGALCFSATPSLEAEEALTIPLPAPSTPPRAFLARLPLSFVRNDGQADAATKFQVRGRGYLLSLEPTEAVMVLSGRTHEGAERHGVRQSSAAFPVDCPPASDTTETARGCPIAPEVRRNPKPVGLPAAPNKPAASFHVLRMRLVGAQSETSISGEDELPGKFNYFIGNDPARWWTQVPTFAKVRYREIYPGIDLVYYGNDGQLEYDFVVAPGADPTRIELAIEGADIVEVDSNGDLRLEVAGRALLWRKPVVFQELSGGRMPVVGEYVLRPASAGERGALRRVGFRVGAYERTLALVIDPILDYSTYLGGGQSDGAAGIAVDAQGSAYVIGTTYAPMDFPTTAGAFQTGATTHGGAFVSKFSPAGNELVYSTFLAGPGGYSVGQAIVVDASGRAIVTGHTESTSFPTRDAFQRTLRGEADAFVAMLNPDGSGLVFSSYLGGTRWDSGDSIAMDGQSNILLAGQTGSANFPVTNAIQSAHAGGRLYDWFVTKIGAAGTNRLFSTYLGGRDWEDEPELALDGHGNVHIAGRVGWDSSYVSVAKLTSDGSALVYYRTNLLEGSCSGMAANREGSVFLTGFSNSDALPTTDGAFQRSRAGDRDAYVAKLNPAGTEFDYLTYVGGTLFDRPYAIAVDAAGNAYVAGNTESADFPTQEPIQAENRSPRPEGGGDAFILKLDPSGSSLAWSTYLGGTDDGSGADGRDEIMAIAPGPGGEVYIAGHASSPDFPLQSPFQSERGWAPPRVAWDAFVAKIAEPRPPSVGITRSGNIVTISWPAAAAGFTLESADYLAPVPSWQAEPTPPEVIGDHNVVTFETGPGPRFFRLRKP